MKSTTYPSPFEQKMISNIRTTVSRLKREGTTGMSLNNLLAVTRVPVMCEGAPADSAGYRRMFLRVAGSLAYRGFEILP